METIWKKFTGDKCLNLAGKPKLFFVQACRGAKFDSGVNIRIRRESQTFKDSSYEISYKIPSHADFLIGNSSFEGTMIKVLKILYQYKNFHLYNSELIADIAIFYIILKLPKKILLNFPTV